MQTVITLIYSGVNYSRLVLFPLPAYGWSGCGAVSTACFPFCAHYPARLSCLWLVVAQEDVACPISSNGQCQTGQCVTLPFAL